MLYNRKNFELFSEFEIRLLNDMGEDKDIIVPIGDRTVNLLIDDMPDFMDSRLQCLGVKNILIRYSEISSMCTIHLLRSIDLYSAILNFEVNIEKARISIQKEEYSASLRVELKKES